MNTHTIDARVGGRSRYPGRAARGPVVDFDGCIAEADRLRRAGAFPQALQVLGRAMDSVQPGVGVDRVEVCTARRMLAEVMCEMGDRPGACEVLTELVAEAQATLGPKHPASVRSLAVLAAVVHELGDYDAAEQLYRDVAERIGADGSRAGSLVRVRLALLQRDRGNLDAAREALAEAYHKHREAFGGDDADTVQMAVQLAEMHRDAGDSATARRVLTVAFVAASATLGDDHELTRKLESDLELLEAPMPSAPVDLPEDAESTRSIKRRHSKKGAAAPAAQPPRPAAARAAAPVAPQPPAGGVYGSPAFGGVPAGPAFGGVPAGPAFGGVPAGPAFGGVPASAPASPAPFRPASAPASPAPYRPVSAPASPAPVHTGAFGPQAAYVTAPAHATAPSALGMPAAAARTAQIPAQARRRLVETEAGFSGRRTPPVHAGYPLSADQFGALAAAETVVTRAVTAPVAIDPVAAPAVPRERPRRRSATVLIVLMVIIAIGAGVALAVIGTMLAGQ